ncbi:CCR4-NOT transcription complex subunit 2-like, partial [Oncorhynchus tshawytscha]
MKRGRRCFGGNRSRKRTRPAPQQLQETPLEVEAGSEGKGCIPSILDVRVHSHLGSARRREINAVTNSMFSATRKRFVEGVESDYPDDTVYYGQTSMFPHPSDKDVSDATSMLQPLTPYYEVTDS